MRDVSNSEEAQAPRPVRAPRRLDDPIDLEHEVRLGWRNFKQNPSDAILAPVFASGVGLALLLFAGAPALFSMYLRSKGTPLFPALTGDMELSLWNVLVMLLIMPVSAWLGLGLAAVFLDLARGRKSSPRRLFAAGPMVVTAILAFALESALATVGVLAFFVGAIAIQMALSLSVFYIVDRGLGPIAALRASLDNTWSWRTVLKLLAIYLLLNVGVVMTCYVGLVVFVPWVFLIFARIYLLLSRRIVCVHCEARLPPTLEVCPGCEGDPRTPPAPPEGHDPMSSSIPSREQPRWIEVGALLGVLPMLAVGANPVGGVFQGMALAPLLDVPRVVGMSIGLGSVIVPLGAAVLLLLYGYRSYRSVDLDEAGAVFGRTDRWEGVRINWRRIKGYWLSGSGGVRLEVTRQPWTRWIGPVIPTEDRDTHDLVVALEARGIYNLGG